MKIQFNLSRALVVFFLIIEDWYDFHRVMPRLAKKFAVIAVDLRGIGGSMAASGGYDAANMAEDIHQLAQQLKLESVYIVGHDLGGMVTYAFVRLYPQVTRGVMILDVPLPGIEGWDEIQGDPSAKGCAQVETGVIRGSVHYVVEDQPEAVADLIEQHASPHSK